MARQACEPYNTTESIARGFGAFSEQAVQYTLALQTMYMPIGFNIPAGAGDYQAILQLLEHHAGYVRR